MRTTPTVAAILILSSCLAAACGGEATPAPSAPAPSSASAPVAAASASAPVAAASAPATAASAPAAGPKSAAMVRHGATVVSGPLAVDAVDAAVQKTHPALRACYEAALAKAPQLAGRISLAFTVDAKGGVKNAKDGGSDLNDAGLSGCLVKAIGEASFPAQKAESSVSYPVIFAPTGGQ